MRQKYSRQREAILNNLKKRYDHPTADEVFMSLKSEIPNISLGTVYRNLSSLNEAKDIQKISTGKIEHFDGNPMPHNHLVCNSCKRVYDIDLEVKTDLINEAQSVSGAKIEEYKLYFYGICHNCRK